MNMIERLIEALKDNEKFVSQGKLLKNKIIESGLQIDPEMIGLIYKDEELKKHFFKNIGEITIFDKDKFMRFVSNKEFLPDSFTAFSNQVGLGVGSSFVVKNKDVVLNFPFKECILMGGQTKHETKRKEIFWNQVLAPDQIDFLLKEKVFINFKRITVDGAEEIEKIEEQDSLIIKGNNLLVLNSLKKKFAGKVKLIYIDPPYNTGSDGFEYNDNFNHSTYLTFMKNRLEVSTKMLDKDKGVIAVQCSFHEYAYLKVLMDEIYGRKNHKCTFNIRVRHEDRILTGDKEFNDVIEYILFYSKNDNYKFPTREEAKEDDDYIYQIKELKKGDIITLNGKQVEVFTPDKYKMTKVSASSKNFKTISVRGSLREKNSSGRFYVKYLEKLIGTYAPLTLFKVPDMGDDIYAHRYFHLPKEGNKNGTYLQGKPTKSDITKLPYANFYDFEKEYNIVAKEGGVDFRNGKKPEKLIKFIIELFTDKKDLVLDYHLGSGTTAAVAHKLNRRYIGIEQMDYIETVSMVRLQNVINGEQTGISELVDWEGGGSFVYMELKELNKKYETAIETYTTKTQSNAIFKEIIADAILNYKVDLAKIKEMEEFLKHASKEDTQKLLLSLLDPNFGYLNYSEMNDVTYLIPESERKINKDFYEKGGI